MHLLCWILDIRYPYRLLCKWYHRSISLNPNFISTSSFMLVEVIQSSSIFQKNFVHCSHQMNTGYIYAFIQSAQHPVIKYVTKYFCTNRIQRWTFEYIGTTRIIKFILELALALAVTLAILLCFMSSWQISERLWIKDETNAIRAENERAKKNRKLN